MKRIAAALSCILLAAMVSMSVSQVPTTMTYQGVLTDATGVPVADGNYSITFRLYDQVSAGTKLWEETQLVAVFGGVFNVVLGSTVPLDLAFGDQYWITMSVNGAAEMTPRTPLTSSAYSLGARTVSDSSVVGQKIATGTVVRSLAGLSDDISIVAEGGAVVTTTDTSIIINAGVGNAMQSPWTSVSSGISYLAGDIGVGTNDVDGKMEIFHNSSLSDPHLLLHENGNDYARLRMQNNNGTNYWTIASYVASNNANSRFNIWNGASGDLVTVTGDGRVGVNVGISPKVPFHVANNNRVLFGTDTLGSGDKLMWLPDLHAFRVGTVATGAASTYWNVDSIGLYSISLGLNTRAQGFGAFSCGRDTEATNSYAFASGYFTNADGQYSTAMGFNTDALALGSTALGYSTDAEQNYSFAAGYFAEAQAIYSAAIGNSVRAQSFSSMAVGRYNVGGGSATAWNTGDPLFEIGNGTGSSSRSNAVTVLKSGNVGVGTTNPLAPLHVNGQIRLQSVEYIEDGGTNEIACRGDLRPTADNTYDLGTSVLRYDDVFATSGVVNTSDARMKKNVKNLGYGLETVMKLRPVSFEWKDDAFPEPKLGLIAQEVLGVVPEVVATHNVKELEPEDGVGKGQLVRQENEILGMYYSDLIPVLIKAVQDQQKIIADLEARLAKVEGN